MEISYTYGEYISASQNKTFSVSVIDAGGAPAISASQTPFTVADAALMLTGSYTFSATEGQASTTQTVATLTDAAGSYSNSSDLSVTIHWGDSMSSAGMLVSQGNGIYLVQGAHTYAEYGNSQYGSPYAITVTASDAGGQTTGPLQTATGMVADAASATGINIGELAGVAFSNVPVATLTDDARGTPVRPI